MQDSSRDLEIGGPTMLHVRGGHESTQVLGKILWISGIVEGVIGTGGAFLAAVCRGGDCPRYNSSSTDVAIFGGVAALGVVSAVVGIVLDSTGSTRIEATAERVARRIHFDVIATRSSRGVGLVFSF
jgi:hypothetical protein